MGEDSSSVVLVGIGGVDGGDEIKWHSAVVNAVAFLAEVQVFKGVGVGDVDYSSWFELMVLKGREDGRVAVDECPEASRGHDEDESLN